EQGVGRVHVGDLDHGRGGPGRLEVLPALFVDRVEVLHVAHVDVDAADVVHGAAGGLDGRLDVLAHLPGLLRDVADARDAAVGPPRRHAGDEYQAALRLDRGGVGEHAARLAQLWAGNL